MRFYFDVGWWIRAGLKEGAQRSQVKEVVLVVNYNAPDHLEDYVHRIGRTGRAGNTGFAYTLITREEADKANDLVDALRSSGETPPPELLVLAEEHQQKVAEKKRRPAGRDAQLRALKEGLLATCRLRRNWYRSGMVPNAA